MKFSYFLVMFLLFSLLAGCIAPAGAPGFKTNIEREARETLITTYDSASWMPGSLKISKDGRSAAYTKNVDDKQVVVVNGKEEPAKYGQVEAYYVVLSPDGKRLAYVVHDEDYLFCVIDGEEGKRYEEIISPVFSGDGRSVAFAASLEKKWFVVVDGQEGEKYDGIDPVSLVFSSSDREIAYLAKRGEKWLVVKGSTEGKLYDDILGGSLHYSPDGKSIVYCAKSGDNWMVVRDEVEGQKYFSVYTDEDSFSPDSKRLAYLAAENKQGFVVLDGQEQKRYWGIGYGSAVFSPDSRRLAYAAMLKGCEHTNEQRQQDGKAHLIEDEVCIVVDGEEGKSYHVVSSPVFSPDSKRIAYFAWVMSDESKNKSIFGSKQTIKEGMILLVDGVEYGPVYENVGMNTLVFSPDSKHVAFVAKVGDQLTLIVDGKPGKLYDGIVASVLLGGNISFDPDGTLRYVAVDGQNVLMVEEKIVDMTAK